MPTRPKLSSFILLHDEVFNNWLKFEKNAPNDPIKMALNSKTDACRAKWIVIWEFQHLLYMMYGMRDTIAHLVFKLLLGCGSCNNYICGSR